jgi:hypothetical protein
MMLMAAQLSASLRSEPSGTRGGGGWVSGPLRSGRLLSVWLSVCLSVCLSAVRG